MAYIQGKHSGSNPAVPYYFTVRMYAGGGKGKEGWWMGELSIMQFELMCDIFDLLLNMPWIKDITKATANDLLAVTDAQRKEFEYGLCNQIDRSQCHLKRSPTALLTSNGAKMNKGVGGKQPHYRSTYADLPGKFTHWSQCRQIHCVPGCQECEAAVQKYGSDPRFQSVGRKGAEQVLYEMGLDPIGTRDELCGLLDQQPNWGQRTPEVIELFHDRYHTCLIGAAYHAELASQEHRWRRLKQKVRPAADGTMETIKEKVLAVWPSLDGSTTFPDARDCRETMLTYKALDAAGTDVTKAALDTELLKQKNKHRDVYCAQKCQLMAVLDMPMSDKQKRNKELVESRVREGKKRAALALKAAGKVEKQMRGDRNKEEYKKPKVQLDRKRRNEDWKTKQPENYKWNPHRPKKKKKVMAVNGNNGV